MRNPRLWLTVHQRPDPLTWPPPIEGTELGLVSSDTIPVSDFPGPFRVSPIFPLVQDYLLPDLQDARVCFFSFDAAFRVLGRIVNNADSELIRRIFFTNGLASVVLLTNDPADVQAVLAAAEVSPAATETWSVRDSRLVAVECRPPAEQPHPEIKLAPYSGLPVDIRATVDEFSASVALVLPKVALHMPSEQPLFEELIALVNRLLTEMLFVNDPTGEPPPTLSTPAYRTLPDDVLLRQTILQQNTDRLLQINSALSYLSTQALSGAVPILERRSLIRRNSLLGVGTAVLALTRMASSIERVFAEANLEQVLDEIAPSAAPLPGLDHLPAYDCRQWEDYSIGRQTSGQRRPPYPKLPFLSGRLGFRETEYTISAALQALVAGATPEWSLLTVSHEMLHGHVRNLLSFVFRDVPADTPRALRLNFYDRYFARVFQQALRHETVLDSIRAILFTYCCLTNSHGSLTRATPPPDGGARTSSRGVGFPRPFDVPALTDLWLTVEHEYRNAAEIIVHVLDLHYFYGSRAAVYIPLVWRSWATLPHVRGDIRQYVLRSLLVLAAKIRGTAFGRFEMTCSRLSGVLKGVSVDGRLDSGTISMARDYLADKGSQTELWPPFFASLIVVDLAQYVFTSPTIRAGLLGGDTKVVLHQEPDGFEDVLQYVLVDDFVDEIVHQPTAFLVDRLTERLRAPSPDQEADAARVLLACCSSVSEGGRDVQRGDRWQPAD